MIRKSWLYSALEGVWILLVVAVAAGTYVGAAEPYLSRSMIPGPKWVLIVAAIAATVPGWCVVTILETRSWVSAGQRADLTAGGPVFVRKPELTGTVNGRPVRVYLRNKSTGSVRGSSKKTFTVVEADLDRDAETGLILKRKESSGLPGTDVGPEAPLSVHSAGDYVAVAGTEGLLESVLTDRTRRKLDEVSDLGSVYVGGVSSLFPDMGSSMVGSLFETIFDRDFPGDGATVATETRGVLLEADKLRARVEAIAAVADAFEEATTDDEWGGSEFGRIED